MSDFCRDFDQLPLNYQQAVIQLVEKVGATTSIIKKRKLYNAFTNKFTMLPKFWISWLEAEREFYGSTFNSKKLPRLQTLEKRALNDFFFSGFIESKASERLTEIDYSFNRCLDPYMNLFRCMYFLYNREDEKIVQLAENIFLCYPHSKLDFVFDIYNELTDEPVSEKMKKQFNFHKDVYEKIMAVNDNDKEWFDAVITVKDFEFVKQNVEFRIAKNPANKNLWKYYIEFLKKDSNKLQALLQIYYRYCNLFIDDQEMKDKYDEAKMIRRKKKHQKTTASIYIPKSINTAPLQMFPDFKTCFQFFSNQNCSLPKTVMTYMMKNFPIQTLQKMFQTCKYFFYKIPTPVIHRLQLCTLNPTLATFNRYSLVTSFHEKNLAKLKNAIISNSLLIQSCDSKLFLKFISSISSSKIKYLRGGKIRMTLKELDFLVGHGKVEVFMTLFEIIDENDNYLLIEDLLLRFPYGRYLNFEFAKYTHNSAANLTKLKQHFIFDQFIIKCVTTSFNPDDFVKFVKANTTFKSFLYVYFTADTQQNVISAFDEIIKNSYFGSTNRPKIYIRAAD